MNNPGEKYPIMPITTWDIIYILCLGQTIITFTNILFLRPVNHDVGAVKCPIDEWKYVVIQI